VHPDYKSLFYVRVAVVAFVILLGWGSVIALDGCVSQRAQTEEGGGEVSGEVSDLPPSVEILSAKGEGEVILKVLGQPLRVSFETMPIDGVQCVRVRAVLKGIGVEGAIPGSHKTCYAALGSLPGDALAPAPAVAPKPSTAADVVEAPTVEDAASAPADASTPDDTSTPPPADAVEDTEDAAPASDTTSAPDAAVEVEDVQPTEGAPDTTSTPAAED